MKLSEYFATERGAQARLAKVLGVPAPLLSAWASEKPKRRRQVPAEWCPLIERATGGAVLCEDLRPDIAWEVLLQRGGGLFASLWAAVVAGANISRRWANIPVEEAHA
ncbi:hypothetical protein D3C87_1862940 [compost metagenome]